MISKELGFIYIVDGERFMNKKEAEEYAKQKSKTKEAGKKKRNLTIKKYKRAKKKK